MNDRQIKYQYDRRRKLPDLIDAAERKLLALYREAQREEMDHLIDTSLVDRQWDREVAMAKLEVRRG